eukprot:TRINITY_DN3766_c0_g1_i1.p1 TRINITY_DN3766_c0_g1~~TRINITY_DN3766_c0_g1_i1.p1  ORF type:complete len:106 (+),score=37.54 TRINITY_DN3766_c0_g1_i1:39-356(+)
MNEIITSDLAQSIDEPIKNCNEVLNEVKISQDNLLKEMDLLEEKLMEIKHFEMINIQEYIELIKNLRNKTNKLEQKVIQTQSNVETTKNRANIYLKSLFDKRNQH